MPLLNVFGPCPPDQFAGRQRERHQLMQALAGVSEQGRAVLVTGVRGSGKSSFVDWARWEIESGVDGPSAPVIARPILETRGMAYAAFLNILKDMQGYRRFSWFHTLVEGGALKGVLDTASALFGLASSVLPVGAGVALSAAAQAASVVAGTLPGQTPDYSTLCGSFINVLNAASAELVTRGKSLCLIVDDAHASSDPDLKLLKDIIDNLPPAILLVLAFRLETRTQDSYQVLRQEIERFGHLELKLGAMPPDEIVTMAQQRFGLVLSDDVAGLLNQRLGDPLCLMAFFNLLHNRRLEATVENAGPLLAQAADPSRVVYSGLGRADQDMVNRLCVLQPPMPISLIARMLNRADLANLADELDASPAFYRRDRNDYEFAQASLREYRLAGLPDDALTELHAHAADCCEALQERLIRPAVDYAIAEHRFLARQFGPALRQNVELSEAAFDHFDLSTTLLLAERALVCMEETGDRRLLGRALFQKGRVLRRRRRFAEAGECLDQCLKLAEAAGDRTAEAKYLRQLGLLRFEQSDYERATEIYARSLALSRELGDLRGVAETLNNLGLIHRRRGEYEVATQLFEESLKLKQELNDRLGMANTLHSIASVHQVQGEFAKARDLFARVLEIREQLHDELGMARALHQLGTIHLDLHEFELARERLERCLEISRRLKEKGLTAQALCSIGNTLLETQNYAAAERYCEESLGLCEELGDRESLAANWQQLARIRQQQGDFAQSQALLEQSLGTYRKLGQAPEIAESLFLLGQLAEAKNDVLSAARNYAAARPILARLKAPLLVEVDAALARIEPKLGASTLAEVLRVATSENVAAESDAGPCR
jgi:tetratricopeptide (TPR) repeat protein